ncbi:MAG TPA: diaminopropionate ammonia-lyase [candidate division Zixibacteria bacterium]|nr:diaminopropionate ammonia-lyase [candidate division Zixibacteria bacterium]
MKNYLINRFRQNIPSWNNSQTSEFERPDIRDVHRSLKEYKPTPLIDLPGLAEHLGIGRLLIKDEAQRFGLKAFKALGATYAIYRFVCGEFEKSGLDIPSPEFFYSAEEIISSAQYTFCTATDGNHGRGVAWTASKLRQNAVIYMPKNTVSARIENIRGHGADVYIVDGAYDDAVRICRDEAEKYGWQIISDTAWPGYETIPEWIMAGYLTIFREIDESLKKKDSIDCFIVQGGVGALAASASWYYNTVHSQTGLRIVSVEPREAACLLESIDTPQGEPVKSRGKLNSIMAGLNCGTPSITAWPFIKQGIDIFITVTDRDAVEAMRTYYYPHVNDPRIVSGESGASSLAALKVLCLHDDYKDALNSIGLNKQSTVVLLNTEADTDPEFFKNAVKS